MKRLVTPAFLMVLALLALSEISARIFFAKDIDGRFAYGYDPQAGFDEHRDGTVQLFRAGGRRFHRQSFQRHRSPGSYRIFVVGDSVPRGPSFKEAYPWVLGEDLRQQGIQAESYNMALPGYGARRCQVVLKKTMEFEPSLIILHVDDLNKWEDEREWRRSQEFKGWHPSHWLMKVFIFRRLYEANLEKVFWPLVPEEVRLKCAVNDADAEVAASRDPKEIAARINLAREKLVENVAMVRRLRIPLLLISQCRVERDEGRPPRLDRRRPGRHVRRPDRSRGLPSGHERGIPRRGRPFLFRRQQPLAEPGASVAGLGDLPENPDGTGRVRAARG